MFQLRVIAGNDEGKEFALEKSTSVLGRKRNCNVVLSSRLVSREHARIQRRQGSYYLLAYDTLNGTFLNDQKIVPQKEVQLKPGDVIRIGDVQLLFHAEATRAHSAHKGEDHDTGLLDEILAHSFPQRPPAPAPSPTPAPPSRQDRLSRTRPPRVQIEWDETSPSPVSAPEPPASASMPAPPAGAKQPQPSQGKNYPVYFGTNRKLTQSENALPVFTGERDNQVHYGKVDVAIPKTHRFGSVGSPWWKRWLSLTDDRLAIQGMEIWSETLFWQNLPKLMELASPVDREALVFLHGFNVDFNEAAIRAAQIGFDLKVPGLTAFFSWPSKGKVTSYAADEATIEASEAAISDFLARFVIESGATGVHVIAHSMGNRGLLRALQRIHVDAERRTSIRFQQIILAAPDLDADLFRDLGTLYAASSVRTTLYASPLDRAVEMSAWVHGAARAGFTPPITIIDGVDTIEVPGFNLLDLGHGYFSEAEAVLHDIFELMHYNEDPVRRVRPRPAEGGQRYWSIGR